MLTAESDKGGYIQPKLDCPHSADFISPLPITKAVEIFQSGCGSCGDKSENWVCLQCLEVFCSRYVSAHMVAHNAETGHHVACSLMDLNTWCYGCDSYIKSEEERASYQGLHLAKFGNLPEANLAITTGASVSNNDEREDSDDDLLLKVHSLADLLSDSKRLAIFTGAGISTSAKIPDFRGPKGVWTLKAKGEQAEGIKLDSAVPTTCHMTLLALKHYFEQKDGGSCYLISQNIDGLHRRSGFAANEISELHGNSFKEDCWQCGNEYLRVFDAAEESGRGGQNCEECLARVPKFCHCTPRKCDCGGVLKDSIIHFGEDLPKEALQKAIDESKKADVCLVLGSSLTVSPANELPKNTKNNGGKLVIVNLQDTPLDRKCDLRIYAKTDKLCSLLADLLSLQVPEFDVDSFFNE